MNFIFDMDDTLYDLMEPFRRAHQELFEEKVKIDPKELFKRSRIHSDIVLEAEERGEISHQDSFHERIYRTYREQGLILTREETAHFEERYRFYQTRIQVFPQIPALFDDCIKKGVLIGVLTNGPGAIQRKKLNYLGISNWIRDDRIFISGEIGVKKPDVEIFRYIEQTIKVLPEETWYVGDTYEVDVIGAKKAGWHSIWYNHRNNACPEKSRADLEIRKRDELFSTIQKLTESE